MEGRIYFAIGFLSAMVAGLLFWVGVVTGFMSFDFFYEKIVAGILATCCGGYTICGLTMWFLNIDDYFFE